jgi:hypothetical protein
MGANGIISQGAKRAVSMIFSSPKFKGSIDGSVGFIEFDLVLKESHEWKTSPTSNPIENGADITDHVIMEQDKLILNGYVTNSSIDIDLASFIGGTVAAYTPFGASSILSEAIYKKPKKVLEAFQMLYKLKEAGKEVSIVTTIKVYKDMVISNISIPREPSDGDAIEVKIELVHIQKVDVEMVEVPKGIKKGKTISKKTATTADNAGKKIAEQAKDGSKKSVIKAGYDGLKSLVGIK